MTRYDEPPGNVFRSIAGALQAVGGNCNARALSSKNRHQADDLFQAEQLDAPAGAGRAWDVGRFPR